MAADILSFREAVFELAGLHLVASQLGPRDLSAILRHAADWLERGLPALGPVHPLTESRDTRPITGRTDGD